MSEKLYTVGMRIRRTFNGAEGVITQVRVREGGSYHSVLVLMDAHGDRPPNIIHYLADEFCYFNIVSLV